MQTDRRNILAGGALAAAGAVLAATERPAYSNFFGAPVRHDRYTRNMHGLVASRVVAEPSLRGGRSLELEFRFSKEDRFGLLVWDLANRRIARLRLAIHNPQPAPVTLRPTLLDTQRRSWQLKEDGLALAPGRWTTVDVALAADFNAVSRTPESGTPDAQDAVFFQLFLRFEPGTAVQDGGAPVLLHLDGLELF